MINTDKLKKILVEYKKDFIPTQWKKRKYKWAALKHFQDHWNVHASDFTTMFGEATLKQKNLLALSYYHPRKMIIEFAKANMEEVRRMFIDLYDESKNYATRIIEFEKQSDTLFDKYNDGTWKNHSQNQNSITTYLWFRYPDNYYIYKFREYLAVAKYLESNFMPHLGISEENLVGSLGMYNEICDHISTDKELIQLYRSSLRDDCYQDPKLKVLTGDICLYICRRNTKKSENKEKDTTASLTSSENSSSKPTFWKISHGTKSISKSESSVFEKKHIIVVDKDTGKKASSSISQGEYFMNTMKKGDFFYLCYSNSIQLLGQLINNKLEQNNEKGGIWYQREYRIIAKSVDQTPYKGVQKWWTPNDNSTCIPVTNEEESLFEETILMPYFNLSINSLLTQASEDNEIQTNSSIESYTKDDFLKEVYITEKQYQSLLSLLDNKNNIILQGAPGVGKTFAAKRLAYAIMGEKDDSRVKLIQFHQNYSYEDFIMGYKPKDDGFELQHGIFYNFCIEASNQPDKKFFFIMDEINRGNLSKIFGELLQLIETDYRGTKSVLAGDGSSFSVPSNLYIIGMMNTADRSLAMIDYALRRRFSFFEMNPAFASKGFRQYQEAFQNETLNAVIKSVTDLNKDIAKDDSLGNGFCIGHSYFCNMQNCTKERLFEIVTYDILPMLSEYWFDDKDKFNYWKDILTRAVNEE